MGKRKRRQRAELPLFDLPLNPDAVEDENRGPTSLDGMDLAVEAATPDLKLDAATPAVIEEAPPAVSVQEAAPAPEPAAPAPEPAAPTPEPAAPAPEPAAPEDPAPEPSESTGSEAEASAPQLDLLDLAVRNEASKADSSQGQEASSTESAEGDSSETVRLGDRLLSGIADLAIQLLMLGLAVTATHGLGVVITSADWMPLALLSLSFSFLYWFVPLAFWGQTPGMAWVGHAARAASGEPLSFRQTFLRWLGALMTLGLAGLPLILAWTGGSLSDRISGSQTVTS